MTRAIEIVRETEMAGTAKARWGLPEIETITTAGSLAAMALRVS
jgi:hypothetical protein